MQSFASVSGLLDQVIREQVHNEPRTKNSLYLITSNTEPIHFYDISKLKLIFPQDDLETYLNSNPQIAQGSTICLENCEINPEYGKDNNVVSCEIQSKSIIIDAGTTNEKKLHSGKIRLQVDVQSGEIPLLPSTRRYIRRSQKQEAVRKQLKKTQAQKVDILSFVHAKKASTTGDKSQSDLFSSQIGAIDSQSIQLLQKLTHFVDKDELFNLLATKPLKNKTSKKAVRLMVIPNASGVSKDQPLAFRKKNYLREQVQELCKHYENLEVS